MLRGVSLRIHRAERTDLLADGLAELLADPLADPFAEEVVVVPARGVERWLTQRLSHGLGVGTRGGDGVCAGVRFLNPHSLVAMLLGKERDDPWDPDRLVWPLLAVIDDSLDDPWCATLATHLGHGLEGDAGALRRSRRYSVARRLAGLFASYAVQRPGLVTDWREGRDTDGCGSPVDPDLAWQPELWRRLVERVGASPPDVRHAETLARLRAGGDGLDLPPRLSLFGHTRLPVTEVELLGALGELRDVHLWLPQVSERLWEDLAQVSAAGPVPRADDPSIRMVGHPLLGSLGRDARELQRTLGVVSTGSTTRTAGSTTRRDVVSRRSLRSLLNHRGRSLLNHRGRSWGGCSTTCAPTRSPTRPLGSSASSTRATGRCRCMPATERPARSTCCARCWSGCSRTTRPWSLATSS